MDKSQCLQRQPSPAASRTQSRNDRQRAAEKKNKAATAAALVPQSPSPKDTTQEEEHQEMEVQENSELQQLKEHHEMQSATLTSLQPFATQAATEQKAKLNADIQAIRHAITLTKLFEERIEVFKAALECRIEAKEEAKDKMVAAELAWEEAWKLTETTSDEHKAKQALCTEMQRLLDTAVAQQAEIDECARQKALADAPKAPPPMDLTIKLQEIVRDGKPLDAQTLLQIQAATEHNRPPTKGPLPFVPFTPAAAHAETLIDTPSQLQPPGTPPSLASQSLSQIVETIPDDAEET